MSIFKSPENILPLVNVPAFIYADPLTPRETEVMEQIALGQTNPEIAVTLVITLGTVRSHVTHILDKLQAHNKMEAVIAAQRLGLIGEQAILSPIAAAILVLLQCQPGALAELATLGIFDFGEV